MPSKPKARHQVQRIKERAHYDRETAYGDSRCGMARARRLQHRRSAVRDSDAVCAPRRCADPARLDRKPAAEGCRRRHRCVRDGDDRRCARAGALAFPSFGELPLGGRVRQGTLDRRYATRKFRRSRISSKRCCPAAPPNRARRIATNSPQRRCCDSTSKTSPRKFATWASRTTRPISHCRTGPAWCRCARSYGDAAAVGRLRRCRCRRPCGDCSIRRPLRHHARSLRSASCRQSNPNAAVSSP